MDATSTMSIVSGRSEHHLVAYLTTPKRKMPCLCRVFFCLIFNIYVSILVQYIEQVGI